MGSTGRDFMPDSAASRWAAYYDMTRPVPRRTKAKVSTSGAGRGRGSTGGRGRSSSSPSVGANGMPMYGWGFGHGGNTGGAQHFQNQAIAEANRQLGSTPTDPFNGATLMDLLNMGNDDSGGNRNGGGGGGGSAAASAATRAAYQNMLDVLKQQATANLGTFDTREGSLKNINAEALARLSGITGGLNTASNEAAAAIRTAMGGADQNLARIASEIAAAQAARQQGAAKTLGAFGVAPSGLDQTPGAADLLGAGRMSLAQQGGAWDAAMAANKQAYGGLTADAQLLYNNQNTALMQQLAAARQQAALQAKADQAQLLLQAAQAGVKL